MTTGEDAVNPLVYGEFSHSFVLEKDQIIQIAVNNLGMLSTICRSLLQHELLILNRFWKASIPSSRPQFPGYCTIGQRSWCLQHNELDFPDIPMRRDTFVLLPDGYIVLRFQANNPGVWLFHCHIEWHVDQGLIATMVEAPLDIQKSLIIPQNHIDACYAGNVPVAGNAAANTVDILNLAGANVAPGPLPAGFTPRGIVALTFSVISALLGLAVIAW
jgi:iron transport multicopper oxidase